MTYLLILILYSFCIFCIHLVYIYILCVFVSSLKQMWEINITEKLSQNSNAYPPNTKSMLLCFYFQVITMGKDKSHVLS